VPFPTAAAIAAAARSGADPAAFLESVLARIRAENPERNCFTEVTAARARAAVATGEGAGALAGVPVAVKNLFDIAGVTTLAGAKIAREDPPASQDATAVARLRAAGAAIVGATNMDEYAYGFVTENAHYGATPNPHDPTRIAGGSSGGSAAAVAAGLVPLALGSDTNGSVRVPAALCGVYGLRPTYGRLSRAGTVLFAPSFDAIGPFARSARDLAIACDAIQGTDPRDPVCRERQWEPLLPQVDGGLAGVRIAIAGGYFASGATAAALAAVTEVARALDAQHEVTLPEAARARQAAFLITAAEGAQQHLENLRARPQDFDPATRDRFLAGALVPSQWVLRAQRFRRWYGDRLRELFADVDVLLTPTTPWAATPLGQREVEIAGQTVAVRPNLGRFTQPLSFVGLPALSVPVVQAGLPLGVQLVGAPEQEAVLLRVAAQLERAGVVAAVPPT